MADDNRPIIIVVKKVKGGHGHHGGAWKVAFADFMTAMFALFLVLWILTQSIEVKSAVASYFRHPTDYEGKPDAFMKGVGEFAPEGTPSSSDSSDEAKGKGKEEGKEKEKKEEKEKGKEKEKKSGGGEGKKAQVGGRTPDSLAGTTQAPISPDEGLRPAPGVERPNIQELQEVRSFLVVIDHLWKVLGKASSFRKFKDNFAIESLEEGMLIQLIEQPGLPLFENESMEFKPAIKEALRLIGQQLGYFPANLIEITGHGTSGALMFPYSPKWLASTYIADLARIELERNGVKSGQITKVAGCSDTRLLKVPIPGKTDQSSSVNQRISILMRPQQWKVENY